MPIKLNPQHKHAATSDTVELDHDAEWLWRVYRSRLQEALPPLPPPVVEKVPARKRKNSR